MINTGISIQDINLKIAINWIFFLIQEALRIMDEVKERLEEEERQCQVSLKNLWDECESCLESTCMRFSTTCRRGVSTFRSKVGRNFVSGKYSWIHTLVLERALLIFSVASSFSYINLLKLIWFGGPGNVKL